MHDLEIPPSAWAGILASYRTRIVTDPRVRVPLLVLAWRKRRTGYTPMRIWEWVRDHIPIDPKRPYFVGTTADGIRYIGDARDYDSWHWNGGGQAERALIERLKDTRPGAYVDVGANAGIVAATVLRGSPARPALAFEPVPQTVRRAAATFALNGLWSSRLFACAIGDADGEIALSVPPDHSGGASAVRGDGNGVTVPCRTLDGLLEDVDVSALKIDVEGYELPVLRGARRTISRRPLIVYEWNEREHRGNGWTPTEANELLASDGGPWKFDYLDADGRSADPATAEHLDVIAAPS